jgi:tryptophanyl-tRNA synthetase
VECKRKLLEALLPAQERMRVKREALLARPKDLDDIVQLGNRKARDTAERTMIQVRQAMRIG